MKITQPFTSTKILYHQLIRILTLTLFIGACEQKANVKPFEGGISIVPEPKEISNAENQIVLSHQSELYSPNPEVRSLLEILKSEIFVLTNVSIQISQDENTNSKFYFEIDTALKSEEYIIDIQEEIKVTGGSYRALAIARTTLLQLMENEANALLFPILRIRDYPNAEYRGLMIDLARNWHPVSSIKKLIQMASYYKSNYVHLHFTDYQSYTLPSTSFPNLSTPEKTYSFEELSELEAYAESRGVTIIPEIDIPGHSSPFVQQYPEIFAIQDAEENPWIINMGNEKTYEALDVLIGELTSIFKSTPYFHIGGDEAIFNQVTNDPKVQAYMKDKQLGEDVHELYRHFIVRLNNIVKKHNKQMCVWEGFRREGKVEIPKDIIVFEFETNRYLPNHLVEDGYTVVNTSWKPLYVVNEKKWEPKTIYNWNIWRWENWFPKAPSIIPIQLEETPLIIGAEMCSWEQPDSVEIPSIRKRLPALNQRIWNTAANVPYDQFMNNMDQTDQKLSLLINDDRQDSLLLGHNFEAKQQD